MWQHNVGERELHKILIHCSEKFQKLLLLPFKTNDDFHLQFYSITSWLSNPKITSHLIRRKFWQILVSFCIFPDYFYWSWDELYLFVGTWLLPFPCPTSTNIKCQSLVNILPKMQLDVSFYLINKNFLKNMESW